VFGDNDINILVEEHYNEYQYQQGQNHYILDENVDNISDNNNNNQDNPIQPDGLLLDEQINNVQSKQYMYNNRFK